MNSSYTSNHRKHWEHWTLWSFC